MIKPKGAAPEDEDTLPREYSEPAGRLEDYSILIHGDKKIGKTSLASKFNSPMFFGFEPGTKGLRVLRRNIRDWWHFCKLEKLYVKDKHFQTGVVDTATIAYRLCLIAVCEKMGIDHPSDEDYGKGWDRVRGEFIRRMTLLQNCGKGTIFIAHSEEKEIKDRRGNTSHKIVSTLPRAAADILEGMVDIWAYYGYEGDERVLYVVGDDRIAAGHRCDGHFLYDDGTPIKMIPMGKSADEAYANLVAAFNNKLKKGGSEEAPKVTKKLKVRN